MYRDALREYVFNTLINDDMCICHLHDRYVNDNKGNTVMNTMDAIKPNVAHEPETVQTMMTLIMINDITSKTALGNPNVNSTYHTDFLGK